MSFVYITDDGEKISEDEVKTAKMCDYCGKLAKMKTGESVHTEAEMPSLHGEGMEGNYSNVCRECLRNGLDDEEIKENIGDPEELKEEEVELV